ncbi:diphthine--ammonia ligase [Candidatus Bathycorpusculum sp.]|uniref:Dph6-related ATP pyrophosphatase n=1 Tax=Candidatus Bathycorpusculum sp. TaxID=2994959 RepID=UPI00283479C9|nr:diphthine--ammonia ligase [Candidatus Termitimicrobium sp.]MCL2431183.1 diphthine--ammonia ligase [Candidatus Termitimicrobium sp.]
MKVIVSWSGGKDSAYAYYLAKQQGHQVVSFLTMMLSEEKSNFHMIPANIIDVQANLAGVLLVKKSTSAQTYETDFKTVLTDLKNKGAEGLVTGDICEPAGHEQGWMDRVCSEIGLNPIKPLWMSNTSQVYQDYLKSGLTAVVVRTNQSLTDWLGRVLDDHFYTDIQKLSGVDPCGEGGEYHTLITDGPDFKEKIELIETEKKRLDNGSGFLEIKEWKLTPK